MDKLFLTLICIVFALFTTAQTTPPRTQPVPPRTSGAAANDTSGGFVIAKIPDMVYTGVAFTPELSIKDGNRLLVKNIDYTLTYQNNINVGVATVSIMGKGNYQGTTSVTFQITPKSINTVGINPIADQIYRGNPIMPDVSIKDGNRPLVKEVDYTLAYSNNINVGGATITITGKGNYKDTKSMTFRINAKSFGGATTGIRPAPASAAGAAGAATTTPNTTPKPAPTTAGTATK